MGNGEHTDPVPLDYAAPHPARRRGWIMLGVVLSVLHWVLTLVSLDTPATYLFFFPIIDLTLLFRYDDGLLILINSPLCGFGLAYAITHWRLCRPVEPPPYSAQEQRPGQQ